MARALIDAAMMTTDIALTVGEKVEVRSIDEGLRGSWHSGIVIECKTGSRRVQYDHVLCDDGFRRLDDCVSVHPVVDGVTSVGRKRLYYRGSIRPFPPLLNLDQLSIHYGQCVDAYYKKAWWEGVVFDHENASEVRSIFFPDIGDVLQVRVDVLRITQDWDEYTREWKPRETWYFLELIKRFEQENILHVSVRQIWYEVREKKAFHLLKEWTNSLTRGCVLENLVREVIDDHSKLAAEKYYWEVVESMLPGYFELQLGNFAANVVKDDAGTEVNTARLITEEKIYVDDFLSKTNTEEESKTLHSSLLSGSECAAHVQLFPSTLSIDNHDASSRLQDLNRISSEFYPCVSERSAEKNIAGYGICIFPETEYVNNSHMEGGRLNTASISNSDTSHEETLHSVLADVPCIAAADDEYSWSKDSNIVGEQVPSNRKVKRKWEIAGNDIVPVAEFLPGSVMEYHNSKIFKCSSTLSSLALNMRKHLAYLGWKVEICKEDGKPRMRYTAPHGKSYMSLATVCKDWDTRTGQCERKKACAPSPSSHAPISSPPPHNIGEPAYLSETVKYYGLFGSGENNKNTAWPRIAKPDDMEDEANKHLMVSEAGICPCSIYKTKMDGGSQVDLTSISNFETTHEDRPYCLPSILPCNEVTINEFSRLEDLNTVGKELPIKKRRKLNWEIAGKDVVPEADCCRESVVEYRKRSSIEHGKVLPNLMLDMREHLDYSGWKVKFCKEEGFLRMYYSSPDGKSHVSLDTVRKNWDTGTEQAEEKKVSAPPLSSHSLISLPPSHDFVQPAKVSEEEKNNTTTLPINADSEEVEDKRNMHLIASNCSVGTKEAGKQVRWDILPSEKPNNSDTTACEAYADGEVNDSVGTAPITEPKQNINVGDEAIGKLIAIQRPLSNPLMVVEFEKEKSLAVGEYQNVETDGVPPLTCNSLVQMKCQRTCCSENKEKKEFALIPSAKVRGDMDDGHCSERSVIQSDSSFSSRSLLSLLIDNDVVLPRAKVFYSKKSGVPVKEGQITREGIKCNCCQNVFGLSKFEVHAGSTYHRPAANLFLEDGRSLSDCQSQLKCRANLKSLPTPPPQPKRNRDTIQNIAKAPPHPKDSRDIIKKVATPSPQSKRSRHLSTNDYRCSVCNLGGVLTFCDHCPSSFHRECLGLKVIPEGKWFCPSCCCGICEKNKFNSGAKKIMVGSMLNCYQCERQYHVGCLMKQGDTNLDRCSQGKWFCNRKCEQVFVGLRKLLGRPVVVGDENLTWTLLKYTPHNDDDDDYDDMDRVETLNNLRHAVSVMHECFDPVKEPRTKIDIIKDVFFSRRSNLKRLNFQGFYTVLLSRDDELISVAAVRVYGEKVAEVPLIGTRFEFRRHGMCRLLMNVLDKKLMELGVERLIFLATPSVLSTWTTSFGFSRISVSERLNLLGYTFLDFQGTAMCHKILTKSAQPIRTQQNFQDGVIESDNVDVNNNSTSPEVIQAEQTDIEILHQGTADVALSGRGIIGGIGTMPLILRV